MSNLIDLFMQNYKHYYFIFLPIVLLMQSLGIPSGSGIIVITTGALAYAGEFNVFLMLLLVWFFSALADGLSFLLWRKLGKKLILRSERISKFITPRLEKMEIHFNKYGKLSIVITRFPLGAMGAIANLSAGISNFRFKTFILSCFAGELLWSSFYIGLGFWFGDGWEVIYNVISEFSVLIALVLSLIIVAYFAIKNIKSRFKSKESSSLPL